MARDCRPSPVAGKPATFDVRHLDAESPPMRSIALRDVVAGCQPTNADPLVEGPQETPPDGLSNKLRFSRVRSAVRHRAPGDPRIPRGSVYQAPFRSHPAVDPSGDPSGDPPTARAPQRFPLRWAVRVVHPSPVRLRVHPLPVAITPRGAPLSAEAAPRRRAIRCSRRGSSRGVRARHRCRPTRRSPGAISERRSSRPRSRSP